MVGIKRPDGYGCMVFWYIVVAVIPSVIFSILLGCAVHWRNTEIDIQCHRLDVSTATYYKCSVKNLNQNDTVSCMDLAKYYETNISECYTTFCPALARINISCDTGTLICDQNYVVEQNYSYLYEEKIGYQEKIDHFSDKKNADDEYNNISHCSYKDGGIIFSWSNPYQGSIIAFSIIFAVFGSIFVIWTPFVVGTEWDIYQDRKKYKPIPQRVVVDCPVPRTVNAPRSINSDPPKYSSNV